MGDVSGNAPLVVVGESLNDLAERYGLPWAPSAPEGGLVLQRAEHGLEIAGDPE